MVQAHDSPPVQWTWELTEYNIYTANKAIHFMEIQVDVLKYCDRESYNYLAARADPDIINLNLAYNLGKWVH